MEWEAAQTVSIWVDDAQSMDYRDAEHFRARSKGERASLLALAVSVLLIKAGRAGGADGHRRGAAAGAGGRSSTGWRWRSGPSGATGARPDYGLPPNDRMVRGGRAIFFSDFLGDIEAMKPVLAHAADQGVRGCFVQVLDESEEVFPFDGRMIFESMGGTTEFETQRARALKDAYGERLAERRERIIEFARHLGWRWYFHHTSRAAARRAALALHGGGRAGVSGR